MWKIERNEEWSVPLRHNETVVHHEKEKTWSRNGYELFMYKGIKKHFWLLEETTQNYCIR